MNSPYTDFLAELVEAWIIPHLLPALAVVGAAFAALSLIWIAASAVRLLRERVGPDARWASISPLTSATLRQAGIEPSCEASTATQQSLVEALLRADSGERRA